MYKFCNDMTRKRIKLAFVHVQSLNNVDESILHTNNLKSKTDELVK